MASTPPIASHPSPSSSSDVEEEESEPEAKVARVSSGEQLENLLILHCMLLGYLPIYIRAGEHAFAST